MAEDIGAESGILFSYGKSIFDLLQGDIIVRCAEKSVKKFTVSSGSFVYVGKHFYCCLVKVAAVALSLCESLCALRGSGGFLGKVGGFGVELVTLFHRI